MAPSSDDRDRNFETALARHFRAGAQPQTTPASPSCADIEALAAYHEGGLSPEQRILWKTHIEGCAHCQGILAQLAATDAIPIDVAGNVEKKKTGGPPLLLKPRRPALWRWAAPAGAIAAGLLVWITVRENKPLQVQEVSSRKEASSAPQVAAPKPAEPETKTPTAIEQQLVAPKPSAIAGTAAVVQQKRDSNRAAGAAAAVPSMPSPTGRERTAENSANLYATAPPQPEVGDRTDAAAKDLKEKAPGFLPPAAAPTPAPPDASEVSALSETVEVEAAPLKTAKSATVNPSDRGALQKQELPMNGRSQALVLLTKGVGGVIIAAPQGTAEWRIGAAGLVEHSSDAGATWTLQSTGVVADLLAGSALSDKVCWIVGRAGTILRTTDGGDHWSKLPPPIVDDFASVFAVNARQAIVSPANGTYQTKDGGATWKKLAPE
jgi:hypothetical protein